MLQKITSMMLIVFINLVGISYAFGANGNSNAEKDARTAAKVKEAVARLGTGEAAQVKVKLKDNRKVEGYVGEIKQDSFTVVNSKTGETTEVTYAAVKKAKGNNFSTGAKIAIGVGIALAILAIVFLAAKKPCDNGGCF